MTPMICSRLQAIQERRAHIVVRLFLGNLKPTQVYQWCILKAVGAGTIMSGYREKGGMLISGFWPPDRERK
jgi:hypothetical protein